MREFNLQVETKEQEQAYKSLIKCVDIIDDWVEQTKMAGLALEEIRDNKYYFYWFDTFDAFCRATWGFSATQARHLITAARSMKILETKNEIKILARVEEASKSATQAIPKKATDDEVVEILKEATNNGEKVPTQASIREASAKILKSDIRKSYDKKINNFSSIRKSYNEDNKEDNKEDEIVVEPLPDDTSLVDEIATLKAQLEAKDNEIATLKEQLKKEKALKEKYHKQLKEAKLQLKEVIEDDKNKKIKELEKEVVKLKRSQINVRIDDEVTQATLNALVELYSILQEYRREAEAMLKRDKRKFSKAFLNACEKLGNLNPLHTDKETLKKVYRELARKYHPDMGGEAELMQQINEAYEFIQKYKGY